MVRQIAITLGIFLSFIIGAYAFVPEISPVTENNELVMKTVITMLNESGEKWYCSEPPEEMEYTMYRSRNFVFIPVAKWLDESYFVVIRNLKVHEEKYQSKMSKIFPEEDFLNQILAGFKRGSINPASRITQIAENTYECEVWLLQGCLFSHLILDGDFIIQKNVKIKDRIISEKEKTFWRGIFEKTPAKAI